MKGRFLERECPANTFQSPPVFLIISILEKNSTKEKMARETY
jgi:hypothetical protein